MDKLKRRGRPRIRTADYWREVLHAETAGMARCPPANQHTATTTTQGNDRRASKSVIVIGTVERFKRRLRSKSPLPQIPARTRNAQPTTPKIKLTIQNLGLLVSAEIAAMAIAIWNMVTPRANTSCL